MEPDTCPTCGADRADQLVAVFAGGEPVAPLWCLVCGCYVPEVVPA